MRKARRFTQFQCCNCERKLLFVAGMRGYASTSEDAVKAAVSYETFTPLQNAIRFRIPAAAVFGSG